jgi:hypothetical protein
MHFIAISFKSSELSHPMFNRLLELNQGKILLQYPKADGNEIHCIIAFPGIDEEGCYGQFADSFCDKVMEEITHRYWGTEELAMEGGFSLIKWLPEGTIFDPRVGFIEPVIGFIEPIDFL